MLHHNGLLLSGIDREAGVSLPIVNSIGSKSTCDVTDVVIIAVPHRALVLRMQTCAIKL